MNQVLVRYLCDESIVASGLMFIGILCLMGGIYSLVLAISKGKEEFKLAILGSIIFFLFAIACNFISVTKFAKIDYLLKVFG